MVETSNEPKVFVFSNESVRKSIRELLTTKNHEHVPGYLALLRSQTLRMGSPSQLSDIVDVYDRYLKVLGPEGEKPYLRPFVSRGKSIWFNENISGSYAPSNVKAAPGPFFKVVKLSGNGLDTTYSLPNDHALRAQNLLLKGNRLPVAALTAFMYRDYGLQLEVPSVGAAVKIFRTEFCLSAEIADQASVFDTIFYDDVANFSDTDIEQFQG